MEWLSAHFYSWMRDGPGVHVMLCAVKARRVRSQVGETPGSLLSQTRTCIVPVRDDSTLTCHARCAGSTDDRLARSLARSVALAVVNHRWNTYD